MDKVVVHNLTLKVPNANIYITHSWEGGRAECYPEKFIVNRGEAEVDNDISKGNNLLYLPLSFVLFVLLYWMFVSPGFFLFYDFDALNSNCCSL